MGDDYKSGDAVNCAVPLQCAHFGQRDHVDRFDVIAPIGAT
jgi:hypothetical protein